MLVEKTHEAVYAAIHEQHTLPGEGMTLDPDKIAAFYAKYGADPAEFKDLMTSRSEEHTSELQSLMRISYAVFCLKKKKQTKVQRKQIAEIHNIQQNII